MRNRLLKLSVIAVLMLSFVAVGCDGESCKGLLKQLESLELQIKDIADQRRAADAAGKDMQGAVDLAKKEQRLRQNFAETAGRYIAKGCEERTGDVPTLPPMMPVTETAFE